MAKKDRDFIDDDENPELTDEDFARAHPYAGDALHLAPAYRPVG